MNPTPYVHHTRTRDGVRIAYWSLGVGNPPLVILPTPQSSHIGIEWENERLRDFYQKLAANRHIVRFDSRGTGLSQRDIGKITLEGLRADIDAVLSDLHLDQVGLLAQSTGCIVALSFAAERPEQVSHCLLWSPIMWGRHNPVVDALAPLIDKDWPLFLRARYRLVNDEDEAIFRARLTQASVTPEFFKEARKFWAELDGSTYLERVQAKTLVLRRRNEFQTWLDVAAAALETRIPNAVAVTLDGKSHEMYGDVNEDIVQVLDAFLEDDEHAGRRIYRPSSEQGFGLSEREMEILAMLAEGYRSKEIAVQLSITLNTVERHIANVYKKTGAHGRAAAVAFALKHGIVQ